MATPPPPPVKIDLRTILSESKRIIYAHPWHFLALSVLFLLPVSFSIFAYPTINQLFFQPSFTTVETHLSFLNRFQQQPPNFPVKTLIFFFLYTVSIITFSLLATGSITYSVYHGFYGRPVKLASTIKSAFTSFFRLLSTCLVSELIMSVLLLILALIFFTLVKATHLLGLQVDFSSPYFVSLCVAFVIIVISIVAYFQVIWIFAYVVVVVESSWGLEPLKRSKDLVKGWKGVALSMLVFFKLISGIVSWGPASRWSNADADKWKNWVFVLDIVSASTILMLFMLYNLAASTVFYVYSKAIHEELAGEIAEEFAREYTSLPFDDGKIPHVVSVVYG